MRIQEQKTEPHTIRENQHSTHKHNKTKPYTHTLNTVLRSAAAVWDVVTWRPWGRLAGGALVTGLPGALVVDLLA